MIATVVIIYAYWRIIKCMFSKSIEMLEIDTNVISSKFILYACALATVIIAVLSDKIIRLCQLVAYYM